MAVQTVAKPAEQAAERVAGALYKAVTTPIVSRRTVTEVETEDGAPKIVEQQVNITPVALAVGALGAFALGLGLRPVIEERQIAQKDGTTHSVQVRRFHWTERPRSVYRGPGTVASDTAQSAVATKVDATWLINSPLTYFLFHRRG